MKKSAKVCLELGMLLRVTDWAKNLSVSRKFQDRDEYVAVQVININEEKKWSQN